MTEINYSLFTEILGDNFKEAVSTQGLLNSFKIQTDSRHFERGDFFIPIKGDKFNGHDYLLSVLETGCSGFVFSDDLNASTVNLVSRLEILAVKVKDTVRALQQIAAYHRKQVKAKVIAITGSNGKTTTKDMILHVLSNKFKTKGSLKSFNNHIGVPLTILSCKFDTDFLVVEMGMNHTGEIDSLMKIIDPDLGVITNVGKAHLGFFNSMEEIVAAKSELVAAMKENGKVFINEQLCKYGEIKNSSNAKLKFFGQSKQADICYFEVKQENEQISGKIRINSNVYDFILPVLGKHNAENFIAAMSICREAGVSVEEIISLIKDFELPAMRLQYFKLNSGTRVINDSYNANPSSFKEAISVFQNIECKGRKILVAGDMLELGKFSKKEHLRLGEIISETDISFVYTFGKDSKWILESLAKEKQGLYFENKKELVKKLITELNSEDFLMLKGSRGNRLEDIIQLIEKSAEVSNV